MARRDKGKNNMKKDYIIVGNKIYTTCGICKKLVQVNKFLLGSLHICLTEKEIIRKYYEQNN